MATKAKRYPAHKSKLYTQFSHLYDLLFERIFYPRIERTLRSLHVQPGARILEVGVGTGLSLAAYPPHARVVGVDLSVGMLQQALTKIQRRGWRHIQLAEMDALHLGFPDSSFEYVTAFHVVSVVPDASQMMREVHRVCQPGGTIVVINHFVSRNRLLAALERGFEPLTPHWGWYTRSPGEVFDGLPLEIIQRYKTSPASLFTIVIARNIKEEHPRKDRDMGSKWGEG